MIPSRAKFRPIHRLARLAALLLAGTALAGLSISPANADEAWTGAASTDWFTASNWSNDGLPTSSDIVTIGTTNPNPTNINGGSASGATVNVGYDTGGGQLTISGGGTLSLVDGLIIGNTSMPDTGAGSVLVTGAGSLVNSIFVSVGSGSDGTLTIVDGATVDAFLVTAGATSNGTINVDGSTLIAQNTLIVNDGSSAGLTGTLSITNGGAAVSQGQTIIGGGPGTATVTVDGAGSSLVTASALTIGSAGTGTLSITDGATAFAGTTILGDAAGSSGTLTVKNAQSELTTSSLTIGNAGNGTMTISDGGSVANTFSDIAAGAGSVSKVTVDGLNSTWFNSGDLEIGGAGNGTLTIQNGGAVTDLNAYLGIATGSTGTALVTGANSTWNTNNLFVGGDNVIGNKGSGTLTVEDGGTVNSGVTDIGTAAGTTGKVTVTGQGSTFTNTGDLFIGAGNSSSGTLDVADQGGVSVDGDLFVAYAPDSSGTLSISGISVVTVDGAVSLATQSGTTGTIDIGGAAGSAALAPGLLDAATIQFGSGNGTINFNHTSDSYVFTPQLSGSGTINQIAGTTDLATDSLGFSGTLNVTGGRLVVDGSLPDGRAVVSGGGILGGDGIVGGIDAEPGGIVAPGNGDFIGTLHVFGDVYFGSGSTYQVQLNPLGDSDQIEGEGTAVLTGGDVQVLLAPGAYDTSTQYTILTAAGGVFGSFAGVSDPDAPFLTEDLSYDPNSNNVYLTIARNSASFASVGATRNQIATGAGTESLGGGSSIHDAIVVLPTAQAAQDAFDQLSGEIQASAKGMLLDDSRFIRDAATGRISAAFGDAGAAPLPVMAYGDGGPETVAADTDRFAVWGQAFGSWGNSGNDGNAAAFDRSTGGLLAGADALVGGWRVGVLGGYNHSTFNVDDRNSAGDSDSYHIGLYGGTNWGAIAFRSGAAYSWSSISTKRSIAFDGFADQLSADYDAGTAQVFGELAYKIDANKFSFEPFANLAYVDVKTDGFSETGGEAALTSAGSNTDTSFTTLGLRGSTGVMLGGIDATARGMLGWRHAFGDVTPTSTFAFAGGDAFTIAGVPIAREAAIVEAGLDLKMSANATLGLSYSGQFGAHAADNGANADLSVKF